VVMTDEKPQGALQFKGAGRGCVAATERFGSEARRQKLYAGAVTRPRDRERFDDTPDPSLDRVPSRQ